MGAWKEWRAALCFGVICNIFPPHPIWLMIRSYSKSTVCVYRVFLSFFSMTWFRAFRGDFGFSFYGEKRTPVTIDIQLVSAIYACVLVSVAAIIVAIGIRGKEVSLISELSSFCRRKFINTSYLCSYISFCELVTFNKSNHFPNTMTTGDQVFACTNLHPMTVLRLGRNTFTICHLCIKHYVIKSF